MESPGRRDRWDAAAVDEGWAAPDSLLGRLQRGRGVGYREALTAPGADALVLTCIADDPRWDQQVEQRAEYYARLVTELGVPVGAITLDVDGPDGHFALAFDVLVELSRGGSTEAAAALHAYVIQVQEPEWWVVDHLWREGGPAVRDGLAELVLARIDDVDLAGAVTLHDDGPWRAWAHHPRVAAALAAATPHEPRPRRPDVSDRTTGELYVLADAAFSPLRTAAFRELSRRGDLVLLDLAERPQLRNDSGFVSALAGPVTDLGVPALARARTWVAGDDESLRGLGQDVVAAHGGPDDAAEILRWFDDAVAAGEWCVSEDLATGLARLDHQPALPSIAYAWESTPHSTARRFYLPALMRLRAPDLRAYVDDAAEDCEDDVRDIARA